MIMITKIAAAVLEDDIEKFEKALRKYNLPSPSDTREIEDDDANAYEVIYWNGLIVSMDTIRFIRGTLSCIPHALAFVENNTAFREESYDCGGKYPFLNLIFRSDIKIRVTGDRDIPVLRGVDSFGMDAVRTASILREYVLNDLASAETAYVRRVLTDSCGCSRRELEELGLGFLNTEEF